MKDRPLAIRSLAPILAAALAACGPGDDAASDPGDAPAAGEEAAPTTQEARAQLPDTTVDAVWSYLQEQDYRGEWALWPGKGELYTGAEPHGMLLTTYVDDTALASLQAGDTILPDGAFVIKENYMPDSTLAAVTVMYKSDGYNPDHNDWWFLKRLADGTVEASGRVPGCQDCHGGRADNDYIMTSTLGEQLMEAAAGN